MGTFYCIYSSAWLFYAGIANGRSYRAARMKGVGRDWGCLEVPPAIHLGTMEVAQGAQQATLRGWLEVALVIRLVPMEVAPGGQHQSLWG
jgi:hypothetical protein